MPSFWPFFWNRETVRIRLYYRGKRGFCIASRKLLARAFIPRKTTNTKENYMKKLLLIALVVSGLAFVPVQSSDAQVSVGIGGVGVGFGYPTYGYGYGNYPYGYYRTYPYYGYYTAPSYYWSGGRRVYYRHHRHHYYRYGY